MHDTVTRVAERTAEAWFATHGSGDVEIALSAVAALSLIDPSTAQARSVLTKRLTNNDGLAATITGIWRTFVTTRPDLVTAAWPLLAPWLSPDNPAAEEHRQQALGVAAAAVRAGLLDLTGVSTRRSVDLLGTVLTTLRPAKALQQRGQYFTPADVATLMARMTGTPADGARIGDPACGSGGLFRAAAEQIRSVGEDPTKRWWVGNDPDAQSIACAAVNAVVWDLGPNVVLGVADTLTDVDWLDRALAQRRETVAISAQVRAVRAVLNLELPAPTTANDTSVEQNPAA